MRHRIKFGGHLQGSTKVKVCLIRTDLYTRLTNNKNKLYESFKFYIKSQENATQTQRNRTEEMGTRGSTDRTYD